MFRKFGLIGVENLNLMDFLLGILSFVVIAAGGILIGLVFALIVSIATR